VGIIAGPHALDSCECMNIEGQTLREKKKPVVDLGSCEFSSPFLGLSPIVAFHVVHS
jgi:hypothetical protein